MYTITLVTVHYKLIDNTLLVLRTRAKLWPEARQNTAQRTIGGGHVGVRTAMDQRSTTGRSGPIRDEGSI